MGSPVIAHDKNTLSPDMSWSQSALRSEQPLKNVPRFQEPLPTMVSAGAELVTARPSTVSDPPTVKRTSLAESTLEQLRSRGEAHKHGETLPSRRTRGHRSDSVATITSDYFRRTAQTTPPSPRPRRWTSSRGTSGS